MGKNINLQLVLPEDTLITQGKENHHLWLLAEGKCEVQVLNNMRKVTK